MVPNRTAGPIIPNGCGSYGLLAPAEYLPVITTCCNEHDVCYGTCSKRKTVCDKKFLSCVLRVCKAFEKTFGLGNDSTVVSSILLKTIFKDYNSKLVYEVDEQTVYWTVTVVFADWITVVVKICVYYYLIYDSILSGCTSVANTMEGTVRRLGCFTYIDSQKSHCYCKRKFDWGVCNRHFWIKLSMYFNDNVITFTEILQCWVNLQGEVYNIRA